MLRGGSRATGDAAHLSYPYRHNDVRRNASGCMRDSHVSACAHRIFDALDKDKDGDVSGLDVKRCGATLLLACWDKAGPVMDPQVRAAAGDTPLDTAIGVG